MRVADEVQVVAVQALPGAPGRRCAAAQGLGRGTGALDR